MIYGYEMTVNGKKISVSLATFEIIAQGAKTKVVLTEQGVYFDANDGPAMRKQGTEGLMDAFAKQITG